MPKKVPVVSRRKPVGKLTQVIKQTRQSTRGAAKITSVKNIQKLELMFKVMEMRRQGYRMEQIAKALRTDSARVSRMVRESLDLTLKEHSMTTEQDRQLQVERLDMLLVKYMPLAEAGSLPSAGMILAIEQRRARLLALDVPEVKKIETTGIREYIGVDTSKV